MAEYVIDLETTFSSDHTLTKHSIEEYVRHPKFEIIGGAVIPTANPKHGEFLIGSELRRFCEAESRTASFIAHHAQFDGFALNHVWGIKPAFWFDTLSMSRAVFPRWEKHSLENIIAYLHLGHPKTVPYNKFRGRTAAEVQGDAALLAELGQGCLHDARMTFALYRRLLEHMPDSELRLIDLNIRLYTEPMLEGDVELFREALEEEQDKRQFMLDECGQCEQALRSDAKFAVALRGAGIDDEDLPRKWSEKQKKYIYAFAKTDEEFIALKDHDDEDIARLVNARLAVKTSIHETRAARFLGMSERGRIPVYLRYYGAHTGRFSGGDKANLQNLPRGSKLRRALRAPSGFCLVWGDFAQIECRILATLAGATKLLDAFRAKRDVYSEFGTIAFGEPVSRETPRLRHPAKETVLGCGYGMGRDHFHKYLKGKGFRIEFALVDKLVTSFREEYNEIYRYWPFWTKALGHMVDHDNVYLRHEHGAWEVDKKTILLPNGMRIDYGDLREVEPEEVETSISTNTRRFKGFYTPQRAFKIGDVHIWGGRVTENLVQALARILLTDAWLELDSEGIPIVLSSHDELVACVPLRDQKACEAKMLEAMVKVPLWLPTLPLEIEIGAGDRYEK